MNVVNQVVRQSCCRPDQNSVRDICLSHFTSGCHTKSRIRRGSRSRRRQDDHRKRTTHMIRRRRRRRRRQSRQSQDRIHGPNCLDLHPNY